MTQFNSLRPVYCFNISDGLKEKQNTHLVIKEPWYSLLNPLGKNLDGPEAAVSHLHICLNYANEKESEL